MDLKIAAIYNHPKPNTLTRKPSNNHTLFLSFSNLFSKKNEILPPLGKCSPNSEGSSDPQLIRSSQQQTHRRILVFARRIGSTAKHPVPRMSCWQRRLLWKIVMKIARSWFLYVVILCCTSICMYIYIYKSVSGDTHIAIILLFTKPTKSIGQPKETILRSTSLGVQVDLEHTNCQIQNETTRFTASNKCYCSSRMYLYLSSNSELI